MALHRSKVLGHGTYLPEDLITNFDLEKMVETNNDWIVERTGISTRHKAKSEQVTTDLALIAAQNALKNANISAQEIDFIIFATASPDQSLPSSACILQHKLGCKNIGAMDLGAACSGFIYAMSVADQFIRSGMYKKILVVGAELLTRLVNYKDRDTCILFGDGAGAFVISRANENDKNIIFSSHLHADGSLGDLFELQAGGTRHPHSEKVLREGLQFMRMKGKEIFKNAVRTMSACCEEALNANNLTGKDVDWVIPHQANSRIVEAVAKHFEISMDKVIMNLHHTGNTSAASVPLAFQEAVEQGRVKRGQLILLTVFGAGLTSGSLLFRY